VKAACAYLAKNGGIRKLIAERQLGERGERKYKLKEIAGKAEAIRRKHTKAKQLLADDPNLRHAWRRYLEDSCGAPSATPNFEVQK
jgi:hypothetical protein